MAAPRVRGLWPILVVVATLVLTLGGIVIVSLLTFPMSDEIED
jgi:hypothetical protein